MIAEKKKEVVIFFAGDSGDGIQLTGGQFTETAGLFGNDTSTFPDFPAEIRAPKGSLGGVSGFQLKFGSVEVYTPGDSYDVLVAMNAAALKTSIDRLKTGGIVMANIDGFDKRSLQLAGYEESPLEDTSLDPYHLIKVDITKLTRNALKGSGLGTKEIDRCKNMFVLGFIYWMHSKTIDYTVKFLQSKFANNPDILNANITALQTGYNYGDTSETFTTRFQVDPAPMAKGVYRNIKGNQATALGLISAAEKANLSLFYGSYPITPASDILHFLSRHKNFGIKTFQAEDEIAAICASIGASYGGGLGVTASSGPGIALKTEAIGLATILELPLVIINVQRGGPSTGLPTKTEQADLNQAIFGRNGEAPIPVIATRSPRDSFEVAFEAARIAIEHMTPVILLSDGYIGNGSEPWKFPKAADLPVVKKQTPKPITAENPFLPYDRNENLVRKWAVPGTVGYEHRIGGLEKEENTGNVSYNPENHQTMTDIRQAKIDKIADSIPEATLTRGVYGDLLLVGWGSSFGSIETAVEDLNSEGYSVGHYHFRYLNPFPKGFGELIKRFKHVLIPEMNSGQLLQIIRAKYLVDAKGLNKVKGLPFTVEEIKTKVKEILK